MILAKTYPSGAAAAIGQTQIEVPNTTIAILTAIIAIVPAGVTALAGAFLTTPAQKSSAAIESTKLELQSRKESAELLRSAMAVEDPDKRSALVRFLYTAKIVDQNESVVGLAAGTIPQWPPSTKDPLLTAKQWRLVVHPHRKVLVAEWTKSPSRHRQWTPDAAWGSSSGVRRPVSWEGFDRG